MTRGSISRYGCLLAWGLCAGNLWAQAPAGARTDRDHLPKPVYKVAQKLGEPSSPGQSEPAAAEHPLTPALQMAHSCLEHIRNDIKDYSCTLVKRERIGGKLNEHEYLFVKIRHESFSAYTYFLAPDKLKGQEAIYNDGKNDGDILGHGVGIQKMIGMVKLKPNSMLAMRGQRYPMPEIGILNLTKRLIEVAEHDKQYGECEVKFFKGAKINGRSCTCIQVVHPTPRKNFKFNIARVFVDDEWNVPVRYEAYDWPAEGSTQPQLLEEYTYLNVKINNGFTDADFDDKNPTYGFH